MTLPFAFDFKRPDYHTVMQWRLDKLYEFRTKPKVFKAACIHYKAFPVDFITDWGVTFDPRNIPKGLPAYCPFILFPKQVEWINWIEERLRNGEPGVCDKSRDGGFSWMAGAYAAAKCIFNEGFSVGFGSRKQEYVDQLGDLKALLPKIRLFISLLPLEFRAGCTERASPHMRIRFPETQSFISGESGDGIGRGDRTAIYFVDESAWLPRPHLVESSLSDTTNCRIDISTPHGMNNPFAKKRFGGIVPVFTLHWRDDPRKDQAWYDRKVIQLDDPVIVAQELDLDYTASVEGVVIPALWVMAAVDAHLKLGIEPKGIRRLGFDIADEGKDKNAVVGRYGILIEYTEEWSGKGDDIYGSVEKVFKRCDLLDYTAVTFDSDGLGAAARGDARKINQERKASRLIQVKFVPFRGSGEVIEPLKDPFDKKGLLKDGEKGRTNEDYFGNRKAQGWWDLRRRFLNTYRAVVKGMEFHPDSLISIPSKLPNRQKLISELSQPVFYQNDAGKIIIDKVPDGASSPNHADAAMLAFARLPRPGGILDVKINPDMVE